MNTQGIDKAVSSQRAMRVVSAMLYKMQVDCIPICSVVTELVAVNNHME